MPPASFEPDEAWSRIPRKGLNNPRMETNMLAATRSSAWIKDAPLGMEYCDLKLRGSSLSARAVAIGSDPVPYRLDYELETHDDWVTSRLAARTHGNRWCRSLVLERDHAGIWTGFLEGEGDLPLDKKGIQPHSLGPVVLDVDVQYSPLTNLMPARRLGLAHVGSAREYTMAWISVPQLQIHEDVQRYTIAKQTPGHNIVRYESADGEFVAMITCDDDALPINYPGIARRI